MHTKSLVTIFIFASLVMGGAPAGGDELNHGAVNEQVTGEEWWDIPYPQRFDAGLLTEPQEALTVSGKDIVNESGGVVVLRGVNIGDPAKLARQELWERRLFEAVAGAKAFVHEAIRTAPRLGSGIGPTNLHASVGV